MQIAMASATVPHPLHHHLDPLSVEERRHASSEDLSGIHPVVGVERLLDGAHHVERGAMLGFHVLHLPVADAVLAGAGAAHRQRASHQLFVQPSRLVDFGGIVGVEQIHQMEIAVSRVPDQADRERRAAALLRSLDDALGQTRDRHADVGGPGSATGSKRKARVVRIVAGLPQPLAILEPGRPLEAMPAMVGRERLDGLRLPRRHAPRCRRGTRTAASGPPDTSSSNTG